MENQEHIKLIVTFVGAFCVVMGVVALFLGLKADGMVDFSAVAKGKIKSGSAGVFLLFFGAIILMVIVLHGNKTSYERTIEGANVNGFQESPLNPLPPITKETEKVGILPAPGAVLGPESCPPAGIPMGIITSETVKAYGQSAPPPLPLPPPPGVVGSPLPTPPITKETIISVQATPLPKYHLPVTKKESYTREDGGGR